MFYLVKACVFINATHDTSSLKMKLHTSFTKNSFYIIPYHYMFTLVFRKFILVFLSVKRNLKIVNIFWPKPLELNCL